MVPVLAHVDALRGSHGNGYGFGGNLGGAFGAGNGNNSGASGAGGAQGLAGVPISMSGEGPAGISGGGGDAGSGGGAGGGSVGGGGGGGGVNETPGRFRGEWAGASAMENLKTFEPAFGGGVGGGGLSPTSMGSGGAHGTAIETQQYELQMRMVDILMESLQYARALRCGFPDYSSTWSARRKLVLERLAGQLVLCRCFGIMVPVRARCAMIGDVDWRSEPKRVRMHQEQSASGGIVLRKGRRFQSAALQLRRTLMILPLP